MPKSFGGAGDGTNPEQLFAAGWASCFVGAVRGVAGVKKVALNDLAVVAEVTLHHDTAAGEFQHRGHAGRDRRLTPREWQVGLERHLPLTTRFA
ncbi:OsmC family protein [Amycolatopsis speibonae]|uniref:OsmC family protein n=1 Tax=Amycolatopsis speibonae TaxID=1450224 RepID=A0ABV7P9I6_9PSEU